MKIAILNSIAVIIRLTVLSILNKFFAIYIGPHGFAMLGQFQNVTQLINTFSGGAVSVGISKYTAEYHDNISKQYKIWQTSLIIASIGSITIGFLVFIFSQSLSVFIFSTTIYSNVFVWFSVTQFFFILNIFLIAILNGKEEFNLYVYSNIAGNISTLIISVIMVINWGLYGALLALSLYQSVSLLSTLFFICKTPGFKISQLLGAYDKEACFNLIKFAFMSIVSSVTLPIVHILIRNYLREKLGWDAVGYWEGMYRISFAYLLIITSFLSVYFLPKLSKLTCKKAIKKEIVNGYRMILPVTFGLCITIFVFRDAIISLLFTEKFSPMRYLFFWQMIGDLLKVCGWLLSYLVLSKAMVGPFVVGEIIFSVLYYILSLCFVPYMNLEGVAFSYALTYAGYWIYMIYVNRNFLLISSS